MFDVSLLYPYSLFTSIVKEKYRIIANEMDFVVIKIQFVNRLTTNKKDSYFSLKYFRKRCKIALPS